MTHKMKIGEAILFSTVAGLAVALILSAKKIEQPCEQPCEQVYKQKSTIIIEEID